MKLMYVTDLHGDKNKYWESMKIAVEKGIGIIVNGGDMLPKLGDRHKEQPIFIKEFLNEYFKKLKEHNIIYLAMLGNDDLLAIDHLFDEVCKKYDNVYNIAGKKVVINGYEFIGMNYILDHPFGCKDRVITEINYIPQTQLSYVASISNESGYDKIYNWHQYSLIELPKMQDVLEQLPEPAELEKTIYIMHMPPAGLKLGKLWQSSLDIGSFDIYNFFKTKQPLLSLHGHIHESPDTLNGKWINYINKTTCIQPGQTERYDSEMVYVEIDLFHRKYNRLVGSVGKYDKLN